MATFYNNLRVGASNNADDVRRLQNALISAGYNVGSTGADGIYGKNTEAAVRAYQKATGLSADGIAGAKTKSALYGGTPAPSEGTSNTAAWLSSGSSNYGGGGFWGAGAYPAYSESADLSALRQRLAAYEATKPGEYTSAYGDQIKDLMDQIANREAFSYDYSDDPLYDQYRQAYTAQGRLAMQDSMGNAAALTGGYGSSYGQQVGQQTYQGYMQALNDKIPELAQDAFAQYQAAGQDMYNRLGMYQNQDASDYEKYLGRLQDYYNNLGYLSGRYDTQYNQDYNQYLNRLAAYQDQRDFTYQQQRDAQDQANWQAEYNLSAQKARSSSRGSPDDAAPEDPYISFDGPDLTLTQAKEAISRILREEGVNAAREEALEMISGSKIIGVKENDVERAMSYLMN